ncbi:MAG TPA: MFS transporter [Phenylobacterium sp.]
MTATLLLLAVTLVSGAATRGLFSTVQEYAKADLGLTDFQLSLVQGLAVSIPVAAIAVPLGRLTDRANRVRLLMALAVIWTAGGFLTAFAGGFAMLFVARMLTGLGAMCVLPVAISIAADLCAPETRGRSLLVLSLGQIAGGAAAFALGGWAFGALSAGVAWLPTGMPPWRGAHLVFATATAVLILPLFALREPARREIGAAAHAGLGPALRELWDRRAFLAPLFLGQLSVVMADTAAGVWATPVLSRVFHQQPAQSAGWLGGVVLLSGVLGSVIGGLAGDAGQRSGRRGGVLLAAVVGAAISIPTALFPLAPSLPLFAGSLGLLLLGGAVSGLVTATAISVLIPNEVRGVCLGAFIVVSAVLGLGVAPTLVTLASDVLGGEAHLAPALAATGVLTGLIAFAGFLFAMRHAPPAAYAASQEGCADDLPSASPGR